MFNGHDGIAHRQPGSVSVSFLHGLWRAAASASRWLRHQWQRRFGKPDLAGPNSPGPVPAAGALTGGALLSSRIGQPVSDRRVA